MRDQTINVTIGCLLHDIGKIVYRSSSESGNHSELGYSFLKKLKSYKDEYPVINCAKYHHAAEIKQSSLSKDDISYICYVADNISAAADRRASSEEGNFDRYIPLSPVFTHLNGEHTGYAIDAKTDEKLHMPIEGSGYKLTIGQYNQILEKIRIQLEELPPREEWINSILSVLEALTSTVPSSTNTKESPDISLYDHLKTTAAIGACISEYFQSNNINDYYEICFKDEEKLKSEKMFLLYSADYSGIQKFISTVSTTNALKSLRSRSFFLELTMEHYIDELLSACSLSRANLLYSGGGHCYILLPNTQSVTETIEKWNCRFNEWLLDNFGNALYLAHGYTDCSANDLTNTPAEEMPYKKIFRDVSHKISQRKSARYTPDQILFLNKKSRYSTGRECAVCGETDNLTQTESGRSLCKWCLCFENLSSKIQKYDVFLVENGNDSSADFSIPSFNGNTTYKLTDVDDAKKKLLSSTVLRIYTKNSFYAGLNYSARIFVGDYASCNELQELSQKSEGIPRLGVCRMDVDNLGQAFVSGFEKANANECLDKKGYVTISRTAAFSRQMSVFFKNYINSLMDGSYDKSKALDVAIVYSGGDDIFIVGSWTDTLEAARKIHNAFKEYSCNTLTISGGIAMLNSHYPIRIASEYSSELESKSKLSPEKNSITLFESSDITSFSWDDYSKYVLSEKLALIEEFFNIAGNEKGNSLLYKMVTLLRDAEQGSNSGMQLARYAYMLARLKPQSKEHSAIYKKFSDKMYSWALCSKDRRQLITAIYIYVYKNRERCK